MTKHKKKGAGGKREKAGRKPKFAEMSDTISKRVPLSKKNFLSKKWDEDLEQYRK